MKTPQTKNGEGGGCNSENQAPEIREFGNVENGFRDIQHWSLDQPNTNFENAVNGHKQRQQPKRRPDSVGVESPPAVHFGRLKYFSIASWVSGWTSCSKTSGSEPRHPVCRRSASMVP